MRHMTTMNSKAEITEEDINKAPGPGNTYKNEVVEIWR